MQLRGRLIGFGFGFIASGIVAIVFITAGVVAKPWFWVLLSFIPTVLLIAAFRSYRQIAKKFPEARDPEAYDQRTLPPIPGARDGNRVFEVRGRKLKVDVHPMFGAIPILILVVCALIWFRQANALILVLGASLVAVWAIVLFVQGRLSVNDGERATISVNRNEIRIPKLLLTYPSRRIVRHRGDDYLKLNWRDVTSWVVRAGDSEDPAIYDVRVTQNSRKRCYEIQRSLLRGFEHELLDAVRSIGQVPVILKDAADH